MEVIQLFAFLALYISSSALKSAYGKDCDPPLHVKDGLIFARYEKSYPDKSTLTVGCRDSYEIEGNENIVCRNGQWRTIPRCVKSVSCGDPPVVRNGRLIRQSTDKMEATYQCNPGYILTVSQKATCHDGQWTSLPVCLSAIREGDTIEQSGPGVSCGDPPDVRNGRLIRQSTDKMEATYQCNPGYILTVSQKATCHDGQWTSLPVCLRHQMDTGQHCGLPRKIDNGDVIHSNSMTARYQCNRYYKLRGSNDVTCRNGQWNDPPTCIPPCTVSSIPAGYNLQLQKQTVYIPEDDSVQFPCKGRTYNYVASSYYGTGFCKNGEVTFTRCTPY